MTDDSIRDNADMWCDLFMAHRASLTEHFHVTRRAELYVRVAGLPIEKVYDALETDAEGWEQRLAALRRQEQKNAEAWQSREDDATS